MPPKVTTLEELLERPICYYCEKDFDDELVLKKHMRQKHLWCPNCRKQLDSAGGVSVHMLQVHKEQFKAVPNALEGREDPNLEIVGSVGFPEQLKFQLHEKIRQKYWQHAAEHKARTGNPLPGSGEVVQNKPVETPEEIRARVAEHIARKRAERAAAAAAANNGQGSGANTPATPDSTTVNGGQQAAPSNPVAPAAVSEVAPPVAYNASSPTNQNFGNGQWSAPHTNPGFLASAYSPWPQNSPAPPHTHMNVTAPHQSLVPSVLPTPPTLPPNPSFNPGQHRPSSVNAPVHPNTGNMGTSTPGAIPTVPAPPRQNSLPSVPGLPQRPAFDSPNFSKEDMAKMHSGQQPIKPPFYGAGPQPPFPHAAAPGPYVAPGSTATNVSHPTYAAPYAQNALPHGTSSSPVTGQLGASLSPNAAHPGPYPPPHESAAPAAPQQTMSIPDQVGQLIGSVTNGTASIAPVPTTEQSAKLSDSAPTKTTGTSRSKKRPSPSDGAEPEPAKKKRKTLLKMGGDVSPEEKLAAKRGW